MLRRSKEDKTPAPTEDTPDVPEGTDQADPIEERVAPLEEFRGKADQWMKETSAQLARVATHVQQDEKRQHGLDKRLAEFEDRIQAMLTLTEALSVGENPFVKGHGEQDPPPAHAPAPAQARNGDLALSDEANGRTAHPDWDKEVEGDPAETEIVRLDAGPAPDEEDRRSTGGPQEPLRGHPNDPSLESYAPSENDEIDEEELVRRLESDEGSPFAEPARPIHDAPRHGPDGASRAEKRLILLQWAALLARQMHRVDIDAFLETYLHTRWVRPEDVEKVRALAADLARHPAPPSERLSREELHVRTILLVSRITSRDPERTRMRGEG